MKGPFVGVGILAVVLGCVGWVWPDWVGPPACKQLRQLLERQQSADKWRSKPKDFSVVPIELINECGGESFRMPFPYKVRLTGTKPADEVVQEFFSLPKATVMVRDIPPFNVSRDHLYTSHLSPFTSLESQKRNLTDAKGCISGGKCALFFDNSWSWDDIEPLLQGSGAEKLFAMTRFGNMFMTNIDAKRVTARLHSASYHGSIALQFAGVKEWKFWNPETVGASGLTSKGNPQVSAFAPFVGMKEVFDDFDHYDVATRPGDLLYFPSYWTHAVWTDAGWNAMINLRMAFTPRTLLASARNAFYIHSPANAVRNSLLQWMAMLLPDTVFKGLVSRSRDTHKITNDAWDTFAELNLGAM